MQKTFPPSLGLPNANSPGIRLPGQSLPCWYFQENERKIISRDRILQIGPSEYFMITERDMSRGALAGYLGRIGQDTPFFEKEKRGLIYFDNYYEEKEGFFTFDGKMVYRLEAIHPGIPLLFKLKETAMENNDSLKNVHHITITGDHNLIAAGSHNAIHVEGNMVDYSELQKLGVSESAVTALKDILSSHKNDKPTLSAKVGKWMGDVTASLVSQGLTRQLPQITDFLQHHIHL